MLEWLLGSGLVARMGAIQTCNDSDGVRIGTKTELAEIGTYYIDCKLDWIVKVNDGRKAVSWSDAWYAIQKLEC